jgi:hypothetical protein
MAHVQLSDTHDYDLVYDDQDIRGWEVRDGAGTVIGKVDDMIVDTDREIVDIVRLDNGQELAARDLYIGDGVVYAESVTADQAGGEVRVYNEVGQVTRRVDVEEGDMVEFRDHYGSSLADSGNDYTYYEPAYTFGFERARTNSYAGHDFDSAENNLRTDYQTAHPDGNYDEHRDAIRFGYDRYQSRRAMASQDMNKTRI